MWKQSDTALQKQTVICHTCVTIALTAFHPTAHSNIHCIHCIILEVLVADCWLQRAKLNQYFAGESKQNWGADENLPSDQSSHCAVSVLLSDFAPLGLLAQLKLTLMWSETYRLCCNLSVCLTMWNTVLVCCCCPCFCFVFHTFVFFLSLMVLPTQGLLLRHLSTWLCSSLFHHLLAFRAAN